MDHVCSGLHTVAPGNRIACARLHYLTMPVGDIKSELIWFPASCPRPETMEWMQMVRQHPGGACRY